MRNVTKMMSYLLAAVVVLAACGGGDSSSGRTRNAVVGEEPSKCITVETPGEKSAVFEINFCQQVSQAVIFYGTSSSAIVVLPESRRWTSENLDLAGAKLVRVQSLDAASNVLFDETIDLTFEDLTAKSCAEGGACKVGDEAPKGGRVFYVADTPQPWGTYLAILPRLSERVKFECNEVVIADTKDGIGQGQSNTQKISDACGDTSPVLNAVKAAGTTTYLPTRAEIVLAAKNLIGVDGFDLSANQANGYPRPAVSDMPIAGVDGVSAIEVNRRARTVDFFAYPNWSHMEVMRTMSDLAIWPVYPFSPGKIAITAVSVRPTPTDSSATETPTTIGNGPSPVCNISEADIIDNAGGDYTTGDLPKTFECADVNGANFTGRDLSNLSFRTANVARANFTNANLSGADFTNANCRGTNFTGATLTGAVFSGELCSQSQATTPEGAESDIEAVAGQCREPVVDVVRIVNDENTTDAPVQVELKQGCDIPADLTDQVRVRYDIAVSGEKHFVGWGRDHEIVLREPGIIEQVLPADSYRLTYIRWVEVGDESSFDVGQNLTGTVDFEVKQGQTSNLPKCAPADLALIDKTLTFPCAEAANLKASHAKWNSPNDEGFTLEGVGQVDISKLPEGWQRIVLRTSDQLLNNSWGLIACHTKCGAVPGSSQYKVMKVNGTVSVYLPICAAGDESIDVGYISPLYKVSDGLLRIPTYQFNPDTDLTTIESPAHGFYVLKRDVTVTMTKSEAVAGVLIAESGSCAETGYSTDLAVFGNASSATIQGNTSAEGPLSNESVVPVVLNLSGPSEPVVLPKDTNYVSLAVVGASTSATPVEVSLDGVTWFPFISSQSSLLRVDKPTKVYVRSSNKDGVEVTAIQEVLPAGSSPDGSSAIPSVDESSDGSSNNVLLIVVALGALLLVLVVGLTLKKPKK